MCHCSQEVTIRLHDKDCKEMKDHHKPWFKNTASIQRDLLFARSYNLPMGARSPVAKLISVLERFLTHNYTLHI